eukprot:1949472-Alexandrium_andersonii.AAC.1
MHINGGESAEGELGAGCETWIFTTLAGSCACGAGAHSASAIVGSSRTLWQGECIHSSACTVLACPIAIPLCARD